MSNSLNEAAATLKPKRRLFSSSTGKGWIGIIDPSYSLERISYMLKPSGFNYVKINTIPLERVRKNFLFSKMPVLFGPKTELVHTFNTIPANRPFVVSAEMELPRFLFNSPAWQKAIGRSVLESSRCRNILALSEAAASHMRLNWALADGSELANKIKIFRGGVLPADGMKAKAPNQPNEPIKLLFIGNDGLRKGLRPTIASAVALRQAGVEVELTIIGKPTATTYIVPDATFDIADIYETIEQHAWIKRYQALPNREVRSLMALHDILVFPTMDESLGWVIAEAALSGLPCISTNVFAIPELIDDAKTGWLIKIPLRADRRWTDTGKIGGKAAWNDVQASLTAQLQTIISSLAQDRSAIAQAGIAAHAHIHGMYNMDDARQQLEQIYHDARA